MRAGEPFLLNPDNRPLLKEQASTTALASDREKGLAKSMRTLLIVGILLAAISALIATLELMYWAEMRESNVQTEATITGSRTYRSDESTSYYVSYTYEHISSDGEVHTYRNEERVSNSIYAAAEPGRRVAAIYIPDDPRSITVDTRLDMPGGGITGVALFLSFFVLPPGIFFFFDWRRSQALQRLRQGGRKVFGTIMSCKGFSGENDYYVHLVYRFQSPTSGKEIQQVRRRVRNDLNDDKLPASGAPVVVLYRDDKTFQVL
jgi:hypothetical protein